MNTNLSALFESANLGELHVGRSLGTGALAIIADGDTVICEFPGEHNFCTEHPEYAQLFVAALNAMPKLLDENYKLKHQVRDTCVRAENAEKSLRAQPAGGGDRDAGGDAGRNMADWWGTPPESGGQGEAVAWQWRKRGDAWSLDKTFNSEVFATTNDSEVRALYTHPPAQASGQSVAQGQGLAFSDATIDKLQEVMAVHGFAVPVRVISDAFRTALYCAAPAQPDGVGK